MGVDHSRSMRLAHRVSESSSDLERRLDASTTVVTVDLSMPLADMTATVLMTTLRRGPGNLVLVSDGLPAPFLNAAEERVAAVDPERPLLVARQDDELPDDAVIVNVGPTAPPGAIRVVPEGFGAHLASGREAVITPRQPGNPVGGVYAAALAAGEVFKHTVSVVPDRRVLHPHLQFCPLSLSADLAAAPPLPSQLELDLTQAGVGAIGTGIVLLLGLLEAEGRLIVVDPQTFAPENVGTYSIGTYAQGQERPLKVEMAKQALPRFDVNPIDLRVDQVVQAIDRAEARWTPTVLTALDSPEARRDAQRLWPDRLIDAQTGDTMLGLCDHRHGTDPCLWCLFAVDRTQPSGAEKVAEELGLSMALLADPDATLIEAHLKGLPPEKQERLRPHLGKPACGLARATGLTDVNAGDYQPSIPFVSLQAACLSVARLVASLEAFDPGFNFVQYDGLIGPQAASLLQMKRRQGCVCQERSLSIEATRARRRTG